MNKFNNSYDTLIFVCFLSTLYVTQVNWGYLLSQLTSSANIDNDHFSRTPANITEKYVKNLDVGQTH